MATQGSILPMINGREYSWGDVRINLLGRTLVGVTAIKYEDKQETSVHYGAGNMPQSYGIGKYSAKASIKLQMKELVALQNSLDAGVRIQDIAPFNIEVSYLNDSNIAVTDTLHNCKFQDNGRDIKQGDTVIEKDIELMISHITWGGK